MIEISGSAGKSLIVDCIKSCNRDSIVLTTERTGLFFSDYIVDSVDSLSLTTLQELVDNDNMFTYFVLYTQERNPDTIKKYKKLLLEFEESRRGVVLYLVFVHA